MMGSALNAVGTIIYQSGNKLLIEIDYESEEDARAAALSVAEHKRFVLTLDGTVNIKVKDAEAE